MAQITHEGFVGPFAPESRPASRWEQADERARDRLISILGLALGIDMEDYRTSLSLVAIPMAAVFLAAAFGTALALGSTSPVDAALGYVAVAVILGASAFLYSGVQRVKAKEILNRTVVERAGDGIITTDKQGKIESINPAAEEIFGYRDAELAGCVLYEPEGITAEVALGPGTVRRVTQENKIDLRVKSTEMAVGMNVDHRIRAAMTKVGSAIQTLRELCPTLKVDWLVFEFSWYNRAVGYENEPLIFWEVAGSPETERKMQTCLGSHP